MQIKTTMFEQTPTGGQDGWLNHVIILNTQMLRQHVDSLIKNLNEDEESPFCQDSTYLVLAQFQGRSRRNISPQDNANTPILLKTVSQLLRLLWFRADLEASFIRGGVLQRDLIKVPYLKKPQQPGNFS